jgi:glycosyltransferase involved in cell wall biosynthesis
MSDLLVSIIVNNYNYEKFLNNAIDSALNQTYRFSEVIVVDDGSTDNSREIITSYGDKVIPILKENGGQASAFNMGFAASKGDIICFLDSDDTFLLEKIEKIVQIFQRHDDIGWCFHALTLVEFSSKKILENEYKFPSSKWDFRLQIKNGKIPYIPAATSSLCFRRSALEAVLPMPESIRITSDNYLKFTSVALSKGFFLSQELTVQNIHQSNAYTFSNNKYYLQAKILVLTAYWLKVKFPSLHKFSDGLLVNAIGIYFCVKKIEPETQELTRRYLSSTDIISVFKILLKSSYYCFKNFSRIRSVASAQKT